MSDRPQRIISRDLSGRPTRSWKILSVTTLSLSVRACVCVCVALAGRNISYNATLVASHGELKLKLKNLLFITSDRNYY